jgi:hypothetical protein
MHNGPNPFRLYLNIILHNLKTITIHKTRNNKIFTTINEKNNKIIYLLCIKSSILKIYIITTKKQ